MVVDTIWQLHTLIVLVPYGNLRRVHTWNAVIFVIKFYCDCTMNSFAD